MSRMSIVYQIEILIVLVCLVVYVYLQEEADKALREMNTELVLWDQAIRSGTQLEPDV